MGLQPSKVFTNSAFASGRSASIAPSSSSATENHPVIVVGGGPAGLRVAQELCRRSISVILFNAERWRPYNRVKLTPFLAGEVQIGRVYQFEPFAAGAPVTQYNGQTIVAIDRAAKTVTNQFGRHFHYSKLVLCLGSRPHIPPIPGRDLSGVFRFRNFDDVENLVARALRSRRTVVVGGGLLGLEAARGMIMRGVDTVVVEHESHLMARQLDHAAGQLLEAQIRRSGLDVRTGRAVKAIKGDHRVEQVTLSDSEAIDCDTVIICTGIRPNIELARDAGIAVGHGIKVSDNMQTSDSDVYAAGECTEHDGHIYGLVAPGLEQAGVVAAQIAGENARYRGSLPTTKLKVVGIDVFSMGDVEQLDQRSDVRTVVWRDHKGASYRRLVLDGMRLVGALGVGEWPELNRIQQTVRGRQFIWPFRNWHFRVTGRLYSDNGKVPVALWPGAATVCNCTGVTREQIGNAIRSGAISVEDIMRETSASTVCGSCRPLVQELAGGQISHDPIPGARIILTASLVAGLAALAVWLLPPWPYSISFETGIGVDRVWLDGTSKQITGFTLLGLSAFGAFLSLRKRLALRWLGRYTLWRIIHTLVGTTAFAVLFLHTGFHLGHNLNRWLMLTFVAVAAFGGLAGLVAAREHVVLDRGGRSLRAPLTWLHIIVIWPLPLLLVLHVVAAYAY